MTRWRGRRVFTRDAVLAMKAMKREGKTPEEIALALDTSPRSVASRLGQLGIRDKNEYLGATVGAIRVAKALAEAKRRRVKLGKLVFDVLTRVIDENLFVAVLDD